MTAPATNERYKPHRLPGAIISHGVWLSYRFPLRYRAGEALLCARGITVSHAAGRPWCRPCGQDAATRRRRRPQPGDPWHLEAVFWTIPGERHALGRAGDQDDTVLDSLVQSRRNTHAAQKVLRTLLKGLTYGPRVLITEKLQRDGAAKRAILPGVDQRQSRYRHTRCANVHRPTRQRASRMQGCTSPGHAQRFLSAYGPIARHCRPRRQ